MRRNCKQDISHGEVFLTLSISKLFFNEIIGRKDTSKGTFLPMILESYENVSLYRSIQASITSIALAAPSKPFTDMFFPSKSLYTEKK